LTKRWVVGRVSCGPKVQKVESTPRWPNEGWWCCFTWSEGAGDESISGWRNESWPCCRALQKMETHLHLSFRYREVGRVLQHSTPVVGSLSLPPPFLQRSPISAPTHPHRCRNPTHIPLRGEGHPAAPSIMWEREMPQKGQPVHLTC
jgi:hypothetical protein